MMNERPFSRDHRYKIVGIYLILGIGWILFSDYLMLLLFKDPAQLTQMQTYKGWAYVLLTAVLLYALMGRYRREDMKRLQALRESDHRLHLTQSVVGIGVWEMDLENRRAIWSDGVADLYGIEPGTFSGELSEWLSLIHPQDRPRIEAKLEALFDSPGPFSFEFRVAPPSGELRWIFSQGDYTLDEQGSLTRLLGIQMDITERKRSEEHQQQAEAVYQSSREGIVITDTKARIVSVNPAALRVCGYSQEELLGQNPNVLKSGRHDRGFYQHMWSSITQQGGWSGEIWNRRKNGTLYPVWLSISAVHDQQGNLINYAGVFTDLTHEKISEAELEHIATHDPLTGLPNRRLLDTRFRYAIEHAQRHQEGLALLLIDLDSFKDINDSYGYAAGDQVLQEMAQRVLRCIGNEPHTLARHSSDELIVLIEALEGPQQAAAMAEQIHEALRQPYELEDGQIFLTACIGISLYPDNGDTPELLIRNADTARHRAKEQGRNRTEFYSEELSRSAVQRLSMKSGLRYALEHQQLELHYQPQLHLKDQRLVGVEALVRWRHTEQGLIPPNRFIPLAEQSGLIEPIGEWVLNEACRQMAAWREANLIVPRVSVNLSVHQLHRNDLLDTVAHTLAVHKLTPSQLELELTETSIMRNPEKAAETLEAMAELGINLAIDDFGTGYSSLSYLQRLRLHRLKIDQSFVKELPDNGNNAAICRAVIAMAHSLGMETVAEGVEQEAQRAFLEAAGCPVGQGWLFAKAMPAEALQRWLKENRIS